MKIAICVTWLGVALATSYVLIGCVGGPESSESDPSTNLNPQPLPPVHEPDEDPAPPPRAPTSSKAGGEAALNGSSSSSSSGSGVPADAADAGPPPN